MCRLCHVIFYEQSISLDKNQHHQRPNRVQGADRDEEGLQAKIGTPKASTNNVLSHTLDRDNEKQLELSLMKLQ